MHLRSVQARIRACSYATSGLQELAHRGAATVRVALGGTDRHPRGYRDLLEREAESVLQDENARLSRGEPRKSVAEIRSQLRELDLLVGRVPGGGAYILLERVVTSCSPPLRDVAAGVERQAMKPRRERSLTPELANFGAELRKCILRGVACILGVGEQMGGEAADTGGVASAERFQGVSIPVLGASDEDGVAEAVVRELGLGPQCGADPAARAQRRLHPPSLLPGGASPAC